MRKLLKKIILILDGTPRVSSKRQSGQSLVELALVLPLLIMLLAGLVEIGWFANNFLTLLDVARAGARRGATLQDDMSARTWENDYRDNTYVAIADLPPDYQGLGIGVMPYENADGTPEQDFEIQQRRAFRITSDPPLNGDCDENTIVAGFYSEVICLMLSSLEPLQFDASTGVDDIVVSGFAVEMVDPPDGGSAGWLGANRPKSGDGPQVVVVGRFPSNANECDATFIAGAETVQAQEPRDPFDFNENGLVDYYSTVNPGVAAPFTWNTHFSEMFGGTPSENELDWGYDAVAADVANAEKQVGFVWTGNHHIGETMCIGSDWTTSEVENLFNLNGFSFDDAPNGDLDRDLIPGQGLVLVEIFWEHKLLLNLPFFTILEDKFDVNVWAAFPMQPVQPNILFYP